MSKELTKIEIDQLQFNGMSFEESLRHVEKAKESVEEAGYGALIDIRDNLPTLTTKEDVKKAKDAIASYKSKKAYYVRVRTDFTNAIKAVLTDPLLQQQKDVAKEGDTIMEEVVGKIKAYDDEVLAQKKAKEEEARKKREAKEKALNQEFNDWYGLLPRLGIFETSQELSDYMFTPEFRIVKEAISTASKEIQEKLETTLEQFEKDVEQNRKVLVSREQMAAFWEEVEGRRASTVAYARGIWETGDEKATSDSFVGQFIAETDALEKPEGVLQITWDGRISKMQNVHVLLGVALRSIYNTFFPPKSVLNPVEEDELERAPLESTRLSPHDLDPELFEKSKVREFLQDIQDKAPETLTPEIPVDSEPGQVYPELTLDKGKAELAFEKAQFDRLVKNVKDAKIDIVDFPTLMDKYPDVLKYSFMNTNLKNALKAEKGPVPGLRITYEGQVLE